MLHICLDDSAYCTISHAVKLGLTEKGSVVLFDDDLSVGNISNCREYEYRKSVIHKMFPDNISNIDDNEIKKELDNFYEILSKENDFIIWYAHNPTDYCNLYYIINLIKNKNIKVIECIKKTVGNITFFYKWVGEIVPEDIPMISKRVRDLSDQEKNEYSRKWELLVLENGSLRAEVSGDIKTVNENYYDNLILKKVPIKSNSIAAIVGKFIGMDKPCLRSWFIVSRIKYLAELGCVKINYRCDRYMLNYIRKLVFKSILRSSS